MRLYIETKKMNFTEDAIEHEIILKVSDEEFYGYNVLIELPGDNKFIQNTLKIFYKKDKEGKDIEEIDYKQFIIREDKTWYSFPLYQIKSGKIIPFNYKDYQYFQNTDRRMALAGKINDLFNAPSELKILRKTIRYILQELKLDYPDFTIMNNKIEEVIKKNPKNN